MQTEEIKVSNKIIKSEDLIEIFNKMNEDLDKYKKISKNEEQSNSTLEYGYQKWTFKDNDSKLSFIIEFEDGTEIKYDNYVNFVTTFKNRLEEIKHIFVHYNLHYAKTDANNKKEYHHNGVSMYIFTNKIDIQISAESNNDIIKELVELIQNKISNSPIKYDEIIKNKSSITLTVGCVIGFVIATAICVLLIIFPTIRTIYAKSIVLYPILCLFITFAIGSVLGMNILDNYYVNILPEKKYINSSQGSKDDIDKYVGTSEVLFGKNANNLENRKKIKELYSECKKYIPYEAIALVVITIIVILIGI